MSVGLLLVTHPGIGTSMLHSARRIVDASPLTTKCIEVPVDTNVQRVRESIARLIEQLDGGDGVLLLTDIFGATPNNLARDFVEPGRVMVLAGLSLPMLVRLYNYADNPLSELCAIAEDGGKRGIICATEQPG